MMTSPVMLKQRFEKIEIQVRTLLGDEGLTDTAFAVREGALLNDIVRLHEDITELDSWAQHLGYELAGLESQLNLGMELRMESKKEN